MVVKDIQKVIEANWFNKAPALDRVSAEVIRAAKRGSITTVNELLKYINAVCVTSNKSAHVLFIKLMDQPKPDFSYWAEHEFFVDESLRKYTDALNALYVLETSGDGGTDLAAYGLNVYTMLFHIHNDIYVSMDQPYKLYKIDSVHVSLLRYMFGVSYIHELAYPQKTNTYDLAWLFHHKNISISENPTLLVDVISVCSDYKPLSDKRVVNYSKLDVSNGTIITFVHKAIENINDLPIVKLIHEAYGLSTKGFNIKEIDNYRLNIFIPKE